MPAASEGLVLIQESAYGTPVLTAGNVDYTLTTSTFPMRLPDSNAFNADFTPNLVTTPFGGGFDVPLDVSIGNYSVKASFTTYAYPKTFAFLLDAAITRINAAGTLPWPTSLPQYDQPSIAAYHYIRYPLSNTVKRRKLTGGKISKLTASGSSSDYRIKVMCDVIFQRETGNAYEATADPTSTEFPFFADTALPTNPYLFQQTASRFKMATVALTAYDSWEFTVENKMDPRFFEGPLLYSCSALGRNTTFSANMLLKNSPDLRAIYQGVADRAFEITMTNGSSSSKIDFGASNHITSLPYELPLGKEKMQKLSVQNRWNISAATDLIITNT